jgi:hypothetical protein
MKTHPVRNAIGILALITISLGTSFALEPILDLEVENAKTLVDSSRFARTIELKNVTAGAEGKDLLLGDPQAVTIPYEEGDPLFRSGSFTWIIRCNLMDIPAQANYSLAGRWESTTDQRVNNLAINGNDGTLSFAVSSDGTSGSIVTCNQIEPLPSEPVTIVARFKAGEYVRCDVFDSKGKLLFKRMNGSDVPTVTTKAPIPFTIGAPQRNGFSLTRFRIWNDSLSDRQVESVVVKDSSQ